MEDLTRRVFWESFSFHSTWILIVLVGIAAFIHLFRTKRSSSREAVIYFCFAWALAILLLGFGGVYWNWQLLLNQSGLSGDIPWEAFKAGLWRSVIPAVLSLFGTIGLFTFATVQRFRMNV